MALSRHPKTTAKKETKERIEYLVNKINSLEENPSNILGFHKKQIETYRNELNTLLSEINQRWDMPKEDHEFGQSCKNK